MNRGVCFFLMMCAGLVTLNAQRARVVDSLLMNGLDAALRHEYVDARAAFERAAHLDPEDPAAVVLLAGLHHQAAEDLSVSFDRRAFDSLITQAEVRSTSGGGAHLPDRSMWRSTARGMLSVIESQSGQWMAAIRDALASASEARASLAQMPDIADAGLPMGNYLYWRSRKTEALQWLPFIPDDRLEGIRLLERCAREGTYHKWAAISSLIWIFHDANELARAASWVEAGLAEYPANRTYLAGSAKVLETLGKFHEAASAWGTIAASLRQDPAAGRYAIFSAVVNQARCLRSGGEAVSARGLLQSLRPPTRREVPEGIAARLDTKIEEYEDLQAALSAERRAEATRKKGR